MESHELLRDVLKKPCVKNVAHALKLSGVLVHKWTEPVGAGRSGLQNPLDRVAQLIRLTGDTRLAKWICRKAGGSFVPDPPPRNGKPAALFDAENRQLLQLARMTEVILRAASGKCITLPESRAIRGQWEDMKSDTEEFVRACERGDFQSPPKCEWLLAKSRVCSRMLQPGQNDKRSP
jgi:hypothetical protein